MNFALPEGWTGAASCSDMFETTGIGIGLR